MLPRSKYLESGYAFSIEDVKVFLQVIPIFSFSTFSIGVMSLTAVSLTHQLS